MLEDQRSSRIKSRTVEHCLHEKIKGWITVCIR